MAVDDVYGCGGALIVLSPINLELFLAESPVDNCNEN